MEIKLWLESEGGYMLQDISDQQFTGVDISHVTKKMKFILDIK